eukprot:517414-Hanusia_phi.AAC.1
MTVVSEVARSLEKQSLLLVFERFRPRGGRKSAREEERRSSFFEIQRWRLLLQSCRRVLERSRRLEVLVERWRGEEMRVEMKEWREEEPELDERVVDETGGKT